MSAFVVEKELIDALVRFACQRETVWIEVKGKHRFLETRDADWVGAELWNENRISVGYRYSEPVEMSGYTFPTSAWLKPHAEAVALLKAADCLEYQSCEHPGWQTSRAKALLDSIREGAWRQLPGYAEANWGAPA